MRTEVWTSSNERVNAVYTFLFESSPMPTTAEQLEGMTDAGEFEILATQVLRLCHDDCRAIVHTGTNSQGKTIRSPIDGFALVPRSEPPRYVMAAFTLSEDLKRKWLFETEPGQGKASEEGDVVKAAKVAEALRREDAEAQFCLYLCTNRVPKLELMQEVYAAARNSGIFVEFLDQSGLRDFLDTKADGQYLRQVHLGIAADRLSPALLHDLSARNLQQYRSETQLGSSRAVVQTVASQTTMTFLSERSVSLVLIVGPSGSGKTVLAQTALDQHLEKGGFGIRVPGEVAEQAIGIDDALEETLRLLHGRLDADVGRLALGLASATEPLLIVIDDVYRTTQPSRLLEKIINWSRPPVEGENLRDHVRILCPIWEAQSNVVELKHRGSHWIRFQSVRSFLRTESVGYLREAFQGSAVVFRAQKLDRFAELLQDDPILLGLFADILLADRSIDPDVVAKNVIGHYVQVSLAELALERGDRPGEYRAALDSLARELLLRRRLRPEWRELEQWFPSPSVIPDLLKKMISSGRICRSVEVHGKERLEFRHDRILEYFLAEAVGTMLVESEDPPEVFRDPYFAAHLGLAIAVGQVPSSRLDWLLENNPVALVASLRSISALPSWAQREITDRVHKWLGSAGKRTRVRRDDAFYLLAETNSPHVLSVTNDLTEYSPFLLEARLRNGDAVAGARALAVRFYPGMWHSWLESLIQDAKENNGPRLVAGLRVLLSPGPDDRALLQGALCLAGYLGDPVLADSIMDAWKKAVEDDDSLRCFLWAGLRCGGEQPQTVLEPMIARLLAVDDTSSASTLSPLATIEEALAFSVRHGFADSVIAYLTKLGEKDEYRWIVGGLLRNMDHPSAIRFLVRVIALRRSQVEKGNFFHFALEWRVQWGRTNGKESGRLSEPSLEELRSIWKNRESPDWLQEYAFEVWAEYTDDLDALREVGLEGHLAETAIRRRAILGDREVASAIKARIAEGDHVGYWLQFVRHVWRPDFEEVLDRILTKTFSGMDREGDVGSNQNHALAHALRDIPVESAERLLLKHWPKLSHVPLFIQAALYLSTEESRRKAAEALGGIDRDADPFEHIGSFFGFKTMGLHDRLRIRHLESLKPHLAEIWSFTIYEMAEWCHRNGFRAWAIQNLEPVCRLRLKEPPKSEDRDALRIQQVRMRWFPTETDVFAKFSGSEAWDAPHRLFHLERLFDEFVDLGELPSRFFRLLETWVNFAPSGQRRDVALAALQMRGNRSDLERLRTSFEASNLQFQDEFFENVRYIVYRRTLE